MSEELVYTGLRCIGIVRDAIHRHEGRDEPGRDGLGRFSAYEQACGAICNHGRQQQRGGYL